MLRTVDEYELRRTDESPGVYAFHLCAIRPATVGLSEPATHSAKTASTVRTNCLTILDRTLELQRLRYEGFLREVDAYPSHGTKVGLKGEIEHTSYLKDQINSIDLSDLPAFVQAVEALATALPPIYVGITEKQSIQTRYKQHKRNHAKRQTGTFGGRLAETGFRWSDILFSFVPATTLRLSKEAVAAIEAYIQYISRPRLGRS